MLDWLQAGMTIAACESACPLERIDTRLLLMHGLGLTRIQLITRSEQPLTGAQVQALQDLFQRRLNGEPVAYIVGEREFFGLNFYVTPDVLIPRPDTELLVELAVRYAPPNTSLLDLGTGSGAIAVAVAHQRPDLNVCALDISTTALSVARENARRHVTTDTIELMQSDWYTAVASRRFHTIVSNPPYIIKDDPHLSLGDLRFEPVNALTDHSNGLSAYRCLIGDAHRHLHQHGWILLEHGYDQAESVRKLLLQAGFAHVQSWHDLSAIERVSGGQFTG